MAEKITKRNERENKIEMMRLKDKWEVRETEKTSRGNEREN